MDKGDWKIIILIVIVILFVFGFLFHPRKKYEEEYNDLYDDFVTLELFFDPYEDIPFDEAKASFDRINEYFSK